jgi:hypothetical protein
MYSKQAALSYLQNCIWTPEKGAFREAYGIDKWWMNDNYVGAIVTRKYFPDLYQIAKDGILGGYTDTRWCVLIKNTADFKSRKLPDWMRYADLVGLQCIYDYLTGDQEYKWCFGILSKMYGLKHPGRLYDMATPFEGYTTYKLYLFALCAIMMRKIGLAKEIISTANAMQFTDGPQIGGIKTEYVPEEWADRYPQLAGLANCETTSLSIIVDDTLARYCLTNGLMVAGGVGALLTGLYINRKRGGKVYAKQG